MRFFRIFLLHFQDVFEQRGRSFVWFLNSIINPFIIILFWKAATSGGKVIGRGWNFQMLASYYFYFMIITTLITSRIERYVAVNDIYQGNLVGYLLRPYSYFWKKFLEDMPNRILQGIYALIMCALFFLFFGRNLFVFSTSLSVYVLAFVSLVLASFLFFSFKMLLGIFAFWVTETDSLFEGFEVLTILFGGNLMPVILLPTTLKIIANFLPFSSMIYFPIVAFLGILNIHDLFFGIFIQCIWLSIFVCLYKAVWHQGIRKFTGLGN